MSDKHGYTNSIEELDRICREITNNENARSLRKEDFEAIDYLNDKEKVKLLFEEDDEYRYWLATQYESYCSDSKSFSAFRVSSGNVSADDLSYSNGDAYSSTYAVRPIVEVEY